MSAETTVSFKQYGGNAAENYEEFFVPSSRASQQSGSVRRAPSRDWTSIPPCWRSRAPSPHRVLRSSGPRQVPSRCHSRTGPTS